MRLLVNSIDSLEDLKQQLQASTTSLESTGMRFDVGKTKILFTSCEAPPKPNVRYPCGVFNKGLGSNSAMCQTCQL